MKRACLTAVFAATLLALPAEAATVSALNDRSIVINGRINLGDEARFLSLLSTLGSNRPIEVYLRSPGGSILAAIKIAGVIHNAGLTTRISYRATCASACVLLFAAGKDRIADAESTIAVHSVGTPSENDADQEMVENGDTLAATTLIGRVMSSYGAPPSVVGKMVATPTDETAVLTLADLQAWNVKILRFVPNPEAPQPGALMPPRSDPPSAQSPVHPTQPFGQAPATWSGNVVRVIETFGPQPWEDKVAYLRDKGSRFFKQCKAGGCYFEATYTGEYATIALYLTDSSGGRRVRQTWCVSDPNGWLRSCFEQGGDNWTMRFDGSDWHKL